MYDAALNGCAKTAKLDTMTSRSLQVQIQEHDYHCLEKDYCLVSQNNYCKKNEKQIDHSLGNSDLFTMLIHSTSSKSRHTQA